MPIGISAKKSLRKSIKNKKDNTSFKNKLKDVIKKFINSPKKENFQEVQAVLDKAERKHLYQKNKVARLKAKYSKKVGKAVEKVIVKKTVKKSKKKLLKKSSKAVKTAKK